ncbi:hypothetical protein [Yaniella sp.]|uniref:hypothetical protein n=1 Tax=Yaniella sp. TaxID=2773929 RepID=UPI00264A3CAE|nr:hypothetical protein [Yaniella sp.]MDN6358905.1 hypothetical protein [Yaniella sp.]
MNTSPKRILWWGVGFLIVGAIAFYAYTSAGVQTALTSDQTSQSLWFWLLSPALSIIQNVAFPVGAALIGAPVGAGPTANSTQRILVNTRTIPTNAPLTLCTAAMRSLQHFSGHVTLAS